MLAVVLSGGGARGAYEAGVWKALRKLHIKYDIVTGTSIGAINGFMMVQKDFSKCLKLWRKINYDLLYDNFDKIDNSKKMYLSYFNSMVKGGLATDKIKGIIDKLYNPHKLYRSKIKYGIVAYNLTTRKAIYATKDDTQAERLKDYILASATCFPIFKATKIDKDLVIDGGYCDNFPINLAIDLGATKIIAVDLDAIGIRKKVKNKDVEIIYIKPNNKLNSFLMFDSNATKRMINLGYNDAMKTFQCLDGNIYTFKKGSLELYFKYKNKIKDVCESLGYFGDFKNFNDDEKAIKDFQKIIENTMEIFKIPVDKIYSLRKANKLLFARLNETENINFDKIELDEIKKILSKDVITKYIYSKLCNNEPISVIFNFFPKEFSAAIYLYVVR